MAVVVNNFGPPTSDPDDGVIHMHHQLCPFLYCESAVKRSPRLSLDISHDAFPIKQISRLGWWSEDQYTSPCRALWRSVRLSHFATWASCFLLKIKSASPTRTPVHSPLLARRSWGSWTKAPELSVPSYSGGCKVMLHWLAEMRSPQIEHGALNLHSVSLLWVFDPISSNQHWNHHPLASGAAAKLK